MTHRDDHDMHDIAMSMPQINVDDNEFDDSQGVDMNVHMDSEAEDDRDNEGARYVDCSNLYNDIDDIGEGDGDLDDSFVVVKGNLELSPGIKTMFNVLTVRIEAKRNRQIEFYNSKLFYASGFYLHYIKN